MDRSCATNWLATCSRSCRIPVIDMSERGAVLRPRVPPLFESRISLFRARNFLVLWNSLYIYIYISQHVELYTLHTSNLLSRFHFSRRREEKGERGACIVRTRAKFVASIRSFPTIRTRVTRLHCGGEDRGKFFPFCNFLSRGAASSQQIPREESLRTVHFVISVGREGMKRAV